MRKLGRNKTPGAIDAIVREIDNREDIRILPLSDLHLGDKNCNIDHVRAMVSKIKDSNTFTFLLGDLMNTAIAGSKSDFYSEKLTPQEQIDECVRLFEPVKDKILAIIPGNHEERISRAIGMDTVRLFAQRLGLEDVYRPDSALVILRVGSDKRYGQKHHRPVFYSFYLNHGHGGGRRPGGKLNGLADFASVIDADVIIQGHTHTPIVFRQAHYRISPQNSNASPHEQVLLNLPSSLDYGGYGMRNGYQPASQKYPEIVLGFDTHRIDVVM